MNRRLSIAQLGAFMLCAGPARAHSLRRPKGIVLNYAFDRTQQGLIRSTAGFPLHTPLAPLKLNKPKNQPATLQINPGQYLEPPPSSQLEIQPNDGWVVQLRVRPQSEGLLYSHGSAENHLAIHIVMGIPIAAATVKGTTWQIRGNHSIIGEWTVITLQLKHRSLLLSVNRERMDTLRLPFRPHPEGNTFRLGHNPAITPQAIKAEVANLKLLRQ